MSCREFRESAAIDALGALEPQERARLALHLDLCPSCAGYRRELEQLPPLLDLAAIGDADPLPAGLEDRIVRRYTAEATPRRRPRLRWFIPAIAGLALGVLATLVAIRTISEAGPRPISIALAGTPAAPDANGTARLEQVGSGTVVSFTAHHLPASLADQHYELWMSDGRENISAGTFLVGPDGEVSTTMTCAGRPGEYALVDVTVEPDGAPAGPQHRVVLRGDVRTA